MAKVIIKPEGDVISPIINESNQVMHNHCIRTHFNTINNEYKVVYNAYDINSPECDEILFETTSWDKVMDFIKTL